jgi:hypothetical protein
MSQQDQPSPEKPAQWSGPRQRPLKPVLLVVAAFSRHAEAIAWGSDRLQANYGPVALTSEPFSFHQTDYYEKTMGQCLSKQFFAFGRLVGEGCLPEVKHHTNTLESELASQRLFPDPRPLNLDPGLLTLGKFLLASTKDQAHRIYLRDHIYAEVTLKYQAGAFHPWPWTYADYREPALHSFLLSVREYYWQQLNQFE